MKRKFIHIYLIFFMSFSTGFTKEWKVVSQMPVPVSGAVAFMHDSLIYIFGGHNSLDFATPSFLQIYNPLQNSWKVDTLASLPQSRYGVNGGIWGDNAYFFGGQSNNLTSNLDVFGLSTDTELTISSIDDNFNRLFASSEIYNGKIYCFGGYSKDPSNIDRMQLPYIFVYDIASHTIENEIKGDYTTELPSYQMTTRIRNRIYILGGVFHGVLNTISYFNIESNTLHRFEKKMVKARWGGTAHALGDSAIILIGGWDGRDQALSEVEKINLKQHRGADSLNITNLNYARAEHVSVKFGKDLYVFGGRNKTDNFGVSVGAVEKFADFEPVNHIIHNSQSPSLFELFNNYPNPFNPSTVISYRLSKSSDVSLKIFDISGRLISSLINGSQPAGRHYVTFNGADLASGMYFYSLVAGKYSQTKRMLLLR